ncbi:hypothetical protein BN1221_00368 [Brenneria goodwinii]|uniref:Uncharacterized protein n=1 Tax=Brenneria goodwinii TaxID=1109412 RepID=A0A0G4JPV8_9GAMM|nr:hypothetical protein BN1221_00368 [Brenneria goodwinii]
MEEKWPNDASDFRVTESGESNRNGKSLPDTKKLKYARRTA